VDAALLLRRIRFLFSSSDIYGGGELREYDWLESQIPVLNRSPWIEQLPLVARRGRRVQDVAAENLGG
jgi:hypothetical protein